MGDSFLTRMRPFIPVVGLLTLLGGGLTTTNVYLQHKANKKLNRIERRVQQLATLIQLQEENQGPAILEMQKNLAEIQDKYRQALAVHADKDKLLQELDQKLRQVNDFAMTGAQVQQGLVAYIEKMKQALQENKIPVPQ